MPARTAPPPHGPSAPDACAHVLVVEADPAARALVADTLEDAGLSVTPAADVDDAMRALAAGCVDLLLVGLDLPEGAERLIRSVRTGGGPGPVPAVLVTGREDPEALGAAFAAGAASFVVKPVNPLLLRYQVQAVLRAARQEREILDAKRRAEQAHAIKANVLRLVQHELRTPLTSIVGFAEHIAAHPRAAEVPEFAALIAAAGRRFTAHVSDLVAAAQVLTADIRLRLDECAVSQVLDAVVTAEADGAEERGVLLRAHDASEAGRVDCDRELVVRALRQLVRNAVQHGEGPIDVMAVRERGAVAFVVRDRGKGVPAEEIEACFEPFRQADDALQRAAPGLGLGLPVARRVFAAHGGSVTLSSAEGVGCLALATLPAPS